MNFFGENCLLIDLFSVSGPKRTKMSPKLISLRIFGNFLCADKAKKGSGCPQSQPRVDFLLSPLDWGGIFCNVSIFSMSKFCV